MRTLYDCQKCNYKWFSSLKKPKKCPRCARYDWDVTRIKSMIKVLK